jgi:hypothetical protein
MSALRKSIDLQSVKARHIVVQNEDGSFPPAFALLAADEKGRGVTEWTQDISVNSVTLVGDASAGVLAYSDVSGLLLNAEPLVGLPPPVLFPPVPDTADLSGTILAFNQFLSIVNGVLVNVIIPPPITSITVTQYDYPANKVDISWNTVQGNYVYKLNISGAIYTNIPTALKTLTGLTYRVQYTVTVNAYSSSLFPGPSFTKTFILYNNNS